MMKLYLAGGISGYSYDEVVSRINQKRAELSAGYECLSPMTGKDELRTEIIFKAHGYDNPVSTNHAIVERDRWMVQQCDVVYADLIGSKLVSIGTCMELAWAALLGKHTVVAMEAENIHRHAFVLEAADVVLETNDEAIAYLITLSSSQL